jgi:hypothetical protein
MPPRSAIPEDVHSLILRSLESPAFLDVLLLLHDGPGRAWQAPDVAATLHLGEVEASRALVTLRQAGILAVTIGKDVAYSYRPQPETAQTIDALADHYRQEPQAVLDLIANRPRQKLRLFADAFRLRKRE